VIPRANTQPGVELMVLLAETLARNASFAQLQISPTLPQNTELPAVLGEYRKKSLDEKSEGSWQGEVRPIPPWRHSEPPLVGEKAIWTKSLARRTLSRARS